MEKIIMDSIKELDCQSLKDLGKLQEAEISIRKAIQLNPDFAMAHSNLGTIFK